MAINLMMTASTALSNQTTRSNDLFDDNDADPESRTGILQDTSSGKLKRDSEETSACDCMLELNEAFKKIDYVMTSLQERSSDFQKSDVERDEIILNLSRSLWNLHMVRHHVMKMEEQNKSLNMVSAPRSTEIITSHGHATTTEFEENEGAVVPNTEVNMTEVQYERSVEDAYIIENESVIIEVEVKDSIESEMLMSMNARTMPMGVLDVPFADDSSDLGSWVIKEARGPCDRDLPRADLAGHSFINLEDRGMMKNNDEAEHVRNTLGIEPRCQVHKRTADGLRAFRGQAIRSGLPDKVSLTDHVGLKDKSGDQPENCCHTSDFFFGDYHLPLRSRSFRSSGTTLQIGSAPNNDCACVLNELNSGELCAMAPDLLRWGDDQKSESADYSDELFEDELNGVSEGDDSHSRVTSKDKFTSNIVADKSYLCDFKIISPTVQVSATNNLRDNSHIFTNV